MSLTITINNLNVNQFSINNNNPLNKGVYIHVLKGDRVGLINRFNKTFLIEPLPFTQWRYSGGESFQSLSELVNYIKNYIEVKGVLDPVTNPSFNDTLFEKLDRLIEIQDHNTQILEQILIALSEEA